MNEVNQYVISSTKMFLIDRLNIGVTILKIDIKTVNYNSDKKRLETFFAEMNNIDFIIFFLSEKKDKKMVVYLGVKSIIGYNTRLKDHLVVSLSQQFFHNEAYIITELDNYQNISERIKCLIDFKHYDGTFVFKTHRLEIEKYGGLLDALLFCQRESGSNTIEYSCNELPSLAHKIINMQLAPGVALLYNYFSIKNYVIVKGKIINEKKEIVYYNFDELISSLVLIFEELTKLFPIEMEIINRKKIIIDIIKNEKEITVMSGIYSKNNAETGNTAVKKLQE